MRRRLFLLSFLTLPLMWLFRRALFGGEAFAFRDASYYYFPYYQYVRDRWSDGIPLWNPLDGLGQPLLGDPTAAVLYPLKLVFCLPLDYTRCLGLYAIAHLVLAGFGAFCLARRFRASRHGAILAAVSYQLSGQVLFQYCNPIYLVGAAWLPFGLLCFYDATQRKNPASKLIGLSVTLSMMIMGGDPQMAVHCVLCAFVWCGLAIARRARFARRARYAAQGKIDRIGIVPLAGACVLAGSLAAVQVLPSQEWAARSDRVNRHEPPRSLLELGTDYLKTGELTTNGLWQRSDTRSEHDKKVYQFSVGPWRWSELFWPNIGGRLGPISTRWMQGLPGEGRMWVPSLYLGFLPAVLALARLRLWNSSRTVQWLSWLTAASLLAGMGEYGLGWIADEIRFQSDQDFRPSILLRGFGGVYWFLTMVVPSYIEFRYPAKWWTVTSLGVSLLAAKGWPLLGSPQRRRVVWRIGIVSSVCCLLLACLGRLVLAYDVPATSFGPYDRELSFQHFAMAIGHTLLVTAVVVCLLGIRKYNVGFAVLCVCVLELVAAQSWTIMTVDAPIHPVPANTQTFWRNSGHNYPASFRTTSSAERIREAVIHDLDTLMPKYHLLTGQRQLNSISAMRCGDLATILNLHDEPGVSRAEQQHLRELLGTHETQRVWLTHDWECLRAGHYSIQELTRRVFLGDGERNFRKRPVLEVGDDVEIADPAPNLSRGMIRKTVCHIDVDTAERVEIVIQTETLALLVLNDQYYPAWNAEIETDDGVRTTTDVHRVNRVMRGVFVPPGTSRIVFAYRPRAVYIGAMWSATAWGGVFLFLLLGWRHQHAQRT